MLEKIIIKRIEDPEEKAQIVTEVLQDLPAWFGLPESTKSYIEEARKLPLWGASYNNEIIGFVTLKESSLEAGEIHCMGVKIAYHRMGIGVQLYLELEKYAKENYKYLQVKTVEEGHYEEYDSTVAFYKALGFSKLEVFPTLWDEWNPCLIMIKAL